MNTRQKSIVPSPRFRFEGKKRNSVTHSDEKNCKCEENGSYVREKRHLVPKAPAKKWWHLWWIFLLLMNTTAWYRDHQTKSCIFFNFTSLWSRCKLGTSPYLQKSLNISPENENSQWWPVLRRPTILPLSYWWQEHGLSLVSSSNSHSVTCPGGKQLHVLLSRMKRCIFTGSPFAILPS